MNQNINRTSFESCFRKAVAATIAFAASMVRQTLPDSWRFIIEPNASYDLNPLVEDERLYPEDSLPAGQTFGPLTFEQARDWLWRDGKVPEWIDVAVHGVSSEHTYVSLVCCGRFTRIKERLYYSDALPPFGIKSPNLPTGWHSVANGRFDLPLVR